MNINGGTILARALRRFGVRTVFSLPGHQILSFFNSCAAEGVRLISTRHELAAVYMAEGISHATQEPGVALLAGGPELTDALTGLAKAYYANTPLLVISGCNPLGKRERGFPQDMDQLELVRPFTKWCKGCYETRRIPEYVSAALQQALSGRPGPVYLEIPYDILEEKVSVREVSFPERPQRIRGCGGTEECAEALRLIGQAKRPLIVAGSGLLWSGAEEELAELVRSTGIPLFLTTAALSCLFPSELVQGNGTFGAGRFSMHALTKADLLILLGTRLSFLLGFGQEPFISAHQKIIQLDVETSEIGQRRTVDVGIVGDLRQTLSYLRSCTISTRPLASWLAYLEEERRKFRDELSPLLGSGRTPIHPLRLVGELEDVRAHDSILVLDGANSVLWAMLGIQPRSASRVIISPQGDLEAIGAGIPHAIAMKLACPDKQVILHTGDGSFGFGAMEFETAVRYGIPFVAVVHNDKGWGMTRDMQVEFYGAKKAPGNELGTVRYDLLVEALGGFGAFVEKPEDIRPAIERAIASGLPSCVNVMVDPRPRSPGLALFMMLEVMLGHRSFYDRIPSMLRKLESWHVDTLVSSLLRRYVEKSTHRGMK